MPKSRLYSDQEVSAILKRAGEMQATESPEETLGLSLEELQEIASEAGFDPKMIAAAAGEMERGEQPGKRKRLINVPTSMHIERVIPGEVDESRYPEVIAQIGEAFGMVGRSGQVGKSLEWTHTSERSSLQVTVLPQNGQTKVRMFWTYPRVVLATFLPATMLSLMPAIVALGNGYPGLAFMLASICLTLGLLGAYAVFSGIVKRKERAAKKLVSVLEDMVELEDPDAEPNTTEAQLDLPDALQEAEAKLRERRRKTRG
ncbi:MAG: hypothetical protein AAF564_02295 [Bacteroidota bacterium]